MIGSVEATIAVLFAIVVLGPIVAERLRIPSIVGLIAGGVIFGPSMVGWLESGGLVDDLGSIGILYLMFLAGLSFDLKSFAANRRMAIQYGLLGFAIPFFLTVLLIDRAEGVETLGALLIGAMWASNTLVAYPEVQAAGVQSTRSVGAAVAAGVVADLLSLTVMAFATSTAVIEIEPDDLPFGDRIADLLGTEAVEPTTPDPTLPLWIGLPLLAGVCFYVLPRVAKWFFVRVGRTRPQRFVFMLALMGAGSTVALLGGMEGLIGAFLAGLGMNRLVPSRGALMERLDFAGSTLFVPVFLVSIGLTIDPAMLFDLETIAIGLLFTGFVVVGKTSAAVVTGRLNNLSFDEVGLMSSLSFGQAASTLAIAEVGSTLGMFGQDIVNAAVLAIVITAFITSIGTRIFARRVTPPLTDERALGEHVLLDTREAGSDRTLAATFAGNIARPDGGVVMPYAVSDGDDPAAARSSVDVVVTDAASLGLDVVGETRVDDSFVEATVHLVAEYGASCIVLEWSGVQWVADYLFGTGIDEVGRNATVPCLAVRLIRPWTRVIVTADPVDSTWRGEDNALALDVAARARATAGLPLVVIGERDTTVATLGAELAGVTFEPSVDAMLPTIAPTDLVILPAHRLRDLPPWRMRAFAKAVGDTNLVVVGGPHRLSISQAVFGHHVSAVSASAGPLQR